MGKISQNMRDVIYGQPLQSLSHKTIFQSRDTIRKGLIYRIIRSDKTIWPEASNPKNQFYLCYWIRVRRFDVMVCHLGIIDAHFKKEMTLLRISPGVNFTNIIHTALKL